MSRPVTTLESVTLREEQTERLRASLRGIVPAAVTLVLLVVGYAVLESILLSVLEMVPVMGRAVSVIFQAALYVGLSGIAVLIAVQLDNRNYVDYGLGFDRLWLRDFTLGILISTVGTLLTVWYAETRGIAAVEFTTAAVNAGGSAIVLVGAITGFAGMMVFVAVYEEVVYRGIMLQNFAEGLSARGISPVWALSIASVASLVLFGAFHALQRGPVVAIDSALVGVTFVLAYLLTGELSLAIGVHFGRLPLDLLLRGQVLGVELPMLLAVPIEAAPYLELTVVHISVISVFIVSVVYMTSGSLQVPEALYRRPKNND